MKSLKNKRLFIFDMDGTLADTDLLLILAWIALYKKYTPNKVPTLAKILSFSGPPIKDSLRQEFPMIPIEESFKAFQDTSGSFYDDYLSSYPGSEQVLEFLSKRGTLAINTNKRHDFAVKALQIMGFSSYFPIIIGGGDTKEPKPSPEGVYQAMAKSGIKKKEEVLYIGDTAFDLMTAERANVDAALVTFGPRPLPEHDTSIFHIDDYHNFPWEAF